MTWVRYCTNQFNKSSSNMVSFASFSFFGQYAYSILSIISGFVALLVTCVVTFFTSIISLARLDIQKIPVSFVSNLMEPAFTAFCAALMVDHDNTNPIKVMALEWFCSRLQSIRKDEVSQRWQPNVLFCKRVHFETAECVLSLQYNLLMQCTVDD